MLWGFTSGLAPLARMPPVSLDGTGGGGWLASIYADDSHVGLLPISQDVMVEQSGM